MLVMRALIYIIKMVMANNKMLNDLHGLNFKEMRTNNDALQKERRDEGYLLMEELKGGLDNEHK